MIVILLSFHSSLVLFVNLLQGMVHHQDTHLHRHLLSHRMKLTRHSCHLGTHMLHRKVKVIKGILMEVGILLHHLSNFLLTRSTSMISIIITVMIIMMMVRPSYRDGMDSHIPSLVFFVILSTVFLTILYSICGNYYITKNVSSKYLSLVKFYI